MTITEQEYDILIEILNKLIDEGGTDESHPFSHVMSAIADVIEEYENLHYKIGGIQ